MAAQVWSRRATLRGAAITGIGGVAGFVLSACGGGSAASTTTSASSAPATSVAASSASSSVASAATTATSSSAAPATSATAATTSSAVASPSTVASTVATSAAVSVAPTSSAAAVGRSATTIDYWHIFGGTDTPTMDHMTAAFNASHPDIVIKSTKLGFGNDFNQKITAALAGGTPPNVWMSGSGPQASAYGVLRVVKAVDSFAKRDGITPDLFVPALQPSFMEAGKMWGLRFNTDDRVLYYNVNAFQEVGLDPAKPPATWDDLIQASQKLTKKAADGTLQRVGWWPAYGQVFFQQLDPSNGGALADEAGTKVLFDDDAGVSTLDFVSKAADAVGPVEQYTAFAKTFGSNQNDPFLAGKIAMCFQGSWLKQTYQQYGASLNYKAALLPFPKKQIGISGGFTLMMPASNPADKDDASWQVMKFLCTDKDQQLFMAKTGQLSGLVSLQNDPYFRQDPILSVVADQLKSTSLFPWQPPLSKLGGALTDATNGAIAKKASSKQLLDTAAQVTQAAIDEYNKQHPEWLQNFGK